MNWKVETDALTTKVVAERAACHIFHAAPSRDTAQAYIEAAVLRCEQEDYVDSSPIMRAFDQVFRWLKTIQPEERDEPEEGRSPFLTVAVYLVDRRWGGPEEGGWWYDAGHPVEDWPCGIPPQYICKAFGAEDRASAISWMESLQLLLDSGPNKSRRSDIGSVLSEGRYEVLVCDGWPTPFPKERPRYE